jgi:ribonuclease HI
VEYPEENALNVYIDGSMVSRPRRGSAAILFVLIDDQGNEEQREEVLSGYAGATQNQMELEAPIQALKMVTGRDPPFEPSRYRKIVIKTDATCVAENSERLPRFGVETAGRRANAGQSTTPLGGRN